MKNLQMKGLICLTLISLTIYGCSEESNEISPVVEDLVTEIHTITSEVRVGELVFEKKTVAKITINSEGELVSSEVLSQTLDGAEMEAQDDGKWTISIASNGESGRASSGNSMTLSEDCDDPVITNVSPLAGSAFFCLYQIETTCFISGYDSEGIYTFVITVDTSYIIGSCIPF